MLDQLSELIAIAQKKRLRLLSSGLTADGKKKMSDGRFRKSIRLLRLKSRNVRLVLTGP
ncbi:hypothetical protein [Pedobacter sp. NJ-S-72]